MNEQDELGRAGTDVGQLDLGAKKAFWDRLSGEHVALPGTDDEIDVTPEQIEAFVSGHAQTVRDDIAENQKPFLREQAAELARSWDLGFDELDAADQAEVVDRIVEANEIDVVDSFLRSQDYDVQMSLRDTRRLNLRTGEFDSHSEAIEAAVKERCDELGVELSDDQIGLLAGGAAGFGGNLTLAFGWCDSLARSELDSDARSQNISIAGGYISLVDEDGETQSSIEAAPNIVFEFKNAPVNDIVFDGLALMDHSTVRRSNTATRSTTRSASKASDMMGDRLPESFAKAKTPAAKRRAAQDVLEARFDRATTRALLSELFPGADPEAVEDALAAQTALAYKQDMGRRAPGTLPKARAAVKDASKKLF